MKISNKILTGIAGLFIVLLMAILIVMRNDIKAVIEANTFINYKSVPVEKFENLNFSGNWAVKIKPGREYKVELGVEGDTIPKSKLENKNGTLYFTDESYENDGYKRDLYVKITVPLLKTIKAFNGTSIYIENYQADSIWITLEDSCTFAGKDNRFKNVVFKTSGENELKMSQTMN